MYRKILVPLDGSKRAERILPHVEEMARRYKAKVIFLHVIEYKAITTTEGSFITMSDQEFDQAKKQAEELLGVSGVAKDSAGNISPWRNTHQRP